MLVWATCSGSETFLSIYQIQLSNYFQIAKLFYDNLFNS
jgi:hypothetical protein